MNRLSNEQIQRAAMFKALGDPTRLHIIEYLRDRCCHVTQDDAVPASSVRPTAGNVCCHLTGAERINSTISHHLKELRLAGLVTAERRGKYIVWSIHREAIAALGAYLSESGPGVREDECCP